MPMNYNSKNNNNNMDNHHHTIYIDNKNAFKKFTLKGTFDYVELHSVYVKKKPESALNFLCLKSDLFNASVNNDHDCGLGIPITGDIVKFSPEEIVKPFDSSKMAKDHSTMFKYFDHEGKVIDKFGDHFEYIVLQVSYGHMEEEFSESESEESVHNNDREKKNRKRQNNYE